MYSIDDAAVQSLRELVNRPAWRGEPHILLYCRNEDADAARAWWTETVGEGPSVALRNVRTPAPEPILTPGGRMVVEGRTQTEPADYVLVDGRHPDVAAFWREFSDAPVAVLAVLQAAA